MVYVIPPYADVVYVEKKQQWSQLPEEAIIFPNIQF